MNLGKFLHFDDFRFKPTQINIVFRVLNLKDNKFKDFQTNEVFAAIQSTIEKLDLSGRHNAAVNLKDLNKSVKYS